jgi:hypothetical protein
MTLLIGPFIAFCKSLKGQMLGTIGGKAKFILELGTHDALCFRVSTGKIRRENIQHIKLGLNRYNETKSLHPGDYANLTHNPSYDLALINLFIKSRSL